MPIRIRKLLAACSVLVFLTGVAAPAYSSDALIAGTDTVSPTVDVLVLRPLGFVGLIGGIGLFAVSLPLIAITRPHEIGAPFKNLVAAPARYLWMDPIGSH